MNKNSSLISPETLTLLLIAFAFSVFSPLAQGTTLVPTDFKDQVSDSDTIIRGRVVSRDSKVVDTSDGQAIVTLTKVKTLETFSGNADETVEIKTLGGKANGVVMNVSGMPELKVGKEYVLFVKDNGSSMCPLVGWDSGARQVNTGTDGSFFLVLPSLLMEEAQRSLAAILEDAKKTTGAASVEVAKLLLSEEKIKNLAPNVAAGAPATVTLDQFRELVKFYSKN